MTAATFTEAAAHERHRPMRVLDLFSGAVGGWSAGLARAGYTTVAACELDPWRRSVFAARHPGCRMYADVRKLTADRLQRDLGHLPDVVVGSPPCQEISAANCKGAGITDDHLFWEWARLVFEIRPIWCAAENSPRARTAGIDGILDALAQASYAPWACVVGADNAGANHGRKRLWLIAADALRAELWEQPGRGEWTHGRAAAVAGDDAQHAPLISGLRFGGIFGRQGDEPTQAGLHDDPNSRHEREQQGAEIRPRCSSGLGGTSNNAWPVVFADNPPHPDRPRHPLGLRVGSNDGEELPSALRDIGLAWPHWNNGIAGLSAACAAAGFGAVDDECGHLLPAGLRNRAIAALGDAVVDKIPEAIGRAMRAP